MAGRLLAMGTQPPTPVAPGALPKSKEKVWRDEPMNVVFRDWFAPVIMHPVMKVRPSSSAPHSINHRGQSVDRRAVAILKRLEEGAL